MKDLDREVLATLPQDVFELLAQYLAGAVVRVDDVVADLELDVLEDHDLRFEFLVLQMRFH